METHDRIHLETKETHTTKARRRSQVARVCIAAVALAGVGLTHTASADDEEGWRSSRRQRPQPVEIADARLKIERNETDGDAGVQVFIDADGWLSMEIFDPRGRRAFRATTHGRMAKQGGTELFLESAEPSFDELPYEEFLERFPEGEYRFRGRGVDGERMFGSAFLTHDVPDGPQLVSPLEGGPLVDADNAVVRWQPVLPPPGSRIIAYQVLVVLPDTGLEALPKLTLDVMMPPDSTELTVPRGFLRRDTDYEWEVLSIEESGNQTLSSSFFRTAP